MKMYNQVGYAMEEQFLILYKVCDQLEEMHFINNL